jgi:hypothetical protein
MIIPHNAPCTPRTVLFATNNLPKKKTILLDKACLTGLPYWSKKLTLQLQDYLPHRHQSRSEQVGQRPNTSPHPPLRTAPLHFHHLSSLAVQLHSMMFSSSAWRCPPSTARVWRPASDLGFTIDEGEESKHNEQEGWTATTRSPKQKNNTKSDVIERVTANKKAPCRRQNTQSREGVSAPGNTCQPEALASNSAYASNLKQNRIVSKGN